MARRLLAEAETELERMRTPLRGRRFGNADLLKETGTASIDALWESLLNRPYPFVRTPVELEQLEARWPDERQRVLDAAGCALAHEVDLLGTGPVDLGAPIDWHRDWKTGRRWPLRYGRRMEYAELDQPTDVKVPWEISRVQWLLPAGQAYCLTGGESFAAGARDVLEDWLRENPYARGVNWAIAMEPALRVFSWSWLFYACGRSEAWSESGFRSRFLRGLYLHGDFVDRHIERSEINGNHYTADVSALVVAGLVLNVRRWADSGWAALRAELPRQVHSDGVDFEASTAYHRLVGELFALPALLRRAHLLDVPADYVERVRTMGRFTDAYTGPDGLAPLWGDADDGRALPLGGQHVNDHRSLPVLTAHLAGETAHGNAEAAWLVGPDAVANTEGKEGSKAFQDGGVFVLRGGNDHVFVDCGPVGLAGRGGHGHNDCLSFEATLDGTRIVVDSGTYVYTASPTERNRFRSTSAHNTPRVDGTEQNRIPESLWNLENDAEPIVLLSEGQRFRGGHTGYLRLADPVAVTRTLALDPERHTLAIHDTFDAEGEHELEIPFHLASGLRPELQEDNFVSLGNFTLQWRGDWKPAIEDAWVSPSYGVRVPARKVVFRREGPVQPLWVLIAPVALDAWAWAERQA